MAGNSDDDVKFYDALLEAAWLAGHWQTPEADNHRHLEAAYMADYAVPVGYLFKPLVS